jgi:hypothetical protein
MQWGVKPIALLPASGLSGTINGAATVALGTTVSANSKSVLLLSDASSSYPLLCSTTVNGTLAVSGSLVLSKGVTFTGNADIIFIFLFVLTSRSKHRHLGWKSECWQHSERGELGEAVHCTRCAADRGAEPPSWNKFERHCCVGEI